MFNDLIRRKIIQMKKEVGSKTFYVKEMVYEDYDWCVFHEHVQLLIKRLFKTCQRLHKETMDFEITTDSDREKDKLSFLYYSKYGHVEIWYQIEDDKLMFADLKTEIYQEVYCLV
ncbi:hypothetical protein [Bacillus sp. NPDC094106]|uniref:hypothetical protein n=1 Tax=Bacillus sp. NPDC094106 TaxID=3363949 RepID=UPI003817EE32